MSTNLEPDPSMIGGVPEAPLAFLPEPVKVFQTRARRFAFLAQSSRLGPYLKFLADLSSLQARLSVMLPPVTPIPAERLMQARAANMPPIDRAALVEDPLLLETLTASITSLRENEQMVISLYYQKNLSMKEIAQVMEVSEPRISQVHSRAIQKLRLYMGKYINGGQ